MPSWKEIYARQLEGAMCLYDNEEFMKLKRTLKMITGMIYNDEMAEELKSYKKHIKKEMENAIIIIYQHAQTLPPEEKPKAYAKMDEEKIWYLAELIAKHQQLAHKYEIIGE